MKIITAVILLFIAVSGLAAYLLRLNRITSLAVDEPKPSTHASIDQVLTITINDDSGYLIGGQQYNLDSVTKLLVKEGKPVPAVAVHATGKKAFGPTVALLEEIRRLGILDIRIMSDAQSSNK